jgi:hypothetical protein
MMTDTSDRLIRDYLDELRARTRDLPKRRREELLAEIEAHIAEALPPTASEAEVRDVLDRLGDPEGIAAEERERLGVAPKRAGALEWIAIALLLIGGVIVPVVGWIVGVLLLWTSSVWNTRDKLIGTLVLPGGLLFPLGFGFVATVSEACHTVVGGAQSCTTSPGFWGRAFAIAMLVVITLAPIVTSIYLAQRAQGSSAAEA